VAGLTLPSEVLVIGGYITVYFLKKLGYSIGENQCPDGQSQIPDNRRVRCLHDIEYSILEEANRRRNEHGIPDLIWHEELARVARLHSENMGSRNFFSHDDPSRGSLKDRLMEGNIGGFGWCGENICMGSFFDPARSAVNSWMGSPGHRRNILNRTFTHTGIGAAMGRDGNIYFTQDFIQL